jgi:hypothetical protein
LYIIRLFDNQIIIKETTLIIIIKYTTTSLKELIELPGLDFYKCYYDGVKMHYTPEAIRCYKTGEVQYDGKINLVPHTAEHIFNSRYLKFKENFWNETNKKYIYPGAKEVRFNHHLLNSEDYDCVKVFQYFPTKYDVMCQKSVYESKYVYWLTHRDFINDKKQIYEFIDNVILENPISKLC